MKKRGMTGRNEMETKRKNCTFYNTGHCKYKSDCRFLHQSEICTIHLNGGKSDKKKSFSNRHPKVCKWLLGKSNCRRQNCDCLHGTLACEDGKQNEAHIFLIFLLTF